MKKKKTVTKAKSSFSLLKTMAPKEKTKTVPKKTAPKKVVEKSQVTNIKPKIEIKKEAQSMEMATTSATNKTYKQLLGESEELKNRIDELNIELDGKNNKKVADKISELQSEKKQIETEIAELKNNLTLLEKRLEEVSSNIIKLSQVGKDDLYEAVSSQRWFLFKEPKEIIFDSYTGILLPNLDFHELKKSDYEYFTENEMLNKIKNCNYGGLGKWELPDEPTLKSVFSDKKFPFFKSLWRIKLINSDIFDITKLSKSYSYSSSETYEFLPYNKTFETKSLDPNKKTISNKERAEIVISIFEKQNWLPIFDEEKNTVLYNKLFNIRPQLFEQYSQIQKELQKLEEQNAGLIDGFNFEVEFEKYDKAEIERSLFSYNNSVIKWLSNLIECIKSFKENEESILSLSEELNQKVEKLTDNFNIEIINPRHEFLKNNLDFNIESVESDFIKMKQKAEHLKEELEKTTDFEKLAIIENQSFPSFNLIAEQTSAILNNRIRKIDWFKQNKEITERIIKIHEEWCENYESFLHADKANFERKAKDELIENENTEKWFYNWKEERDKLENRILPLLKYSFEGKIEFDTLNNILEKVTNYKDDLNNFYMNERIPIYVKNADKDNEELLDNIYYEKEIFDLSEKFQQEIEDLIFSTEQTEARLILAKWASEWLDERISRIVALSQHSSISELISQSVVTRVREFKRQSFASLIRNKEIYVQQREENYNSIRSLTRKMLKEIENQNSK